MSLRVFVKSATDLPKLDRFSNSDPYCELTFNDERRTTKVINNDQSPDWNEAFKWTLEVVPESTEVIKVDVLNRETLEKSRALAKGTVPLASVLEQGSTSLDVALTSPEGEPLEAKLHVDLNFRFSLSEALKEEVSTAQARIEELEGKLSATQGQVERLNTTVAKKDGEIANAKEEIQLLEEDISRREAVAAS